MDQTKFSLGKSYKIELVLICLVYYEWIKVTLKELNLIFCHAIIVETDIFKFSIYLNCKIKDVPVKCPLFQKPYHEHLWKTLSIETHSAK